MLAECPICGEKTDVLSIENGSCPKCGSALDAIAAAPPPASGALGLPQRRSPSMRDGIELEKQKTRHNFGVERVEVYSTWEESLEHRPIDIPLYTAPEGWPVIAVVFSRQFMRGPAEVEALGRTKWPFALHVQPFLDAAYPVLRMNLLIPDDPKSPLWLESPLDVCQGDAQDFLEAAVQHDRVDLVMTHETQLSSVLTLSFDANGLAALLRKNVPPAAAAVPPNGSHTDFLQAVNVMERAFPNSWSGIDPANTVKMTFRKE
jgi:hypothetical protein